MFLEVTGIPIGGDMLVRVICKDGRWGSFEDCDLVNYINTGNVAAFFCPHSNEWIDVGDGFCLDCSIKHLMPTGNFHTCFFSRQQEYVEY